MSQKYRNLYIRAAEIRLELLKMFSYGKAHHFGGCFSCVDILTVLYFKKMNYTKENWNEESRDRFIMSKGHSVPTQYVALAMLGINQVEELKTIKQLGSIFQGHPDVRKTRGIEAPTGSLGQGLSFANGIALAGRQKKLDFKEYVVVGDGELQEGQVWEAMMTTAHYSLENICLIIDSNKIQSQGTISEIKNLQPLKCKMEAFGWDCVEVDGHDIGELCSALEMMNDRKGKPLAIIANTIKGKGITFIENSFKYHNYSLTKEQYLLAEKELLENIHTLQKEG